MNRPVSNRIRKRKIEFPPASGREGSKSGELDFSTHSYCRACGGINLLRMWRRELSFSDFTNWWWIDTSAGTRLDRGSTQVRKRVFWIRIWSLICCVLFIPCLSLRILTDFWCRRTISSVCGVGCRSVKHVSTLAILDLQRFWHQSGRILMMDRFYWVSLDSKESSSIGE